VRITPLGGCGEFGLHSTLLQSGGEAILVDAGLAFPDEDTPGVDHLVPEYSALAGAGLQAIFLTHGHEDHVGALAWALREGQAPVYGTPMTIALAKNRLEEYGVRADLRPFHGGERITAGGFAVSAFAMRHSVPGALGLLVEAGGARAFLTGDHKGPDGQLPHEVDVMLGDSTGALRPGRAPDETDVARALAATLDKIPRERRVVVTLFASNVERVQALIDVAARAGRTVGVVGRSLRNATDAARRLGLLRAPGDVWLSPHDANLVLATGGQGEEGAALARIAGGIHPDVALTPGDYVILSGRPVPGNERAVARLSDALAERGLVVLDTSDLHATGHGCRDDLSDIIHKVAPTCVVPMHGGPRHLHAHAELALSAGADSWVVRNGQSHEIVAGALRPAGTLPVGRHAIEGGKIVPDSIVRARRAAARGGVVSIAGDHVVLEGISGVSIDDVRAAFREEGEVGVRRVVRRVTGRRPLVIVHT
jgi:ribonuclease J